jgi:hypothetical protein
MNKLIQTIIFFILKPIVPLQYLSFSQWDVEESERTNHYNYKNGDVFL